MEMSTIKSLWQDKNPGGNIWISESNGQLRDSGKQTGKFGVTYSSDGKIYTYSFKSVYKLAERLNLIPDNNLDYMTESKKAIQAMNNGESFISICGLHDTIAYLVGRQDGKTVIVEAEEIENDIYGRRQWKFMGYKVYNNYQEYEESKQGKW
jgi:hypothetical protein